jgi:hypothetical protein
MNKPDWIAIEGDYRAGIKSLRAMAAQYSVPESTIRLKAKKNNWIRDATGTKRRIVADRLAGVAQDPESCALRNIQDEAAQDVQDMETGLQGARLALRRAVAALLPPSEEEKKIGMSDFLQAKDLKILSECIRLNIETLRMIRGLDDPTNPKNTEDIDAEIEAELAKLAGIREARQAS